MMKFDNPEPDTIRHTGSVTEYNRQIEDYAATRNGDRLTYAAACDEARRLVSILRSRNSKSVKNEALRAVRKLERDFDADFYGDYNKNSS